MNTYIVLFKKTGFSSPQHMKVMADNIPQARQCVRECEGNSTIILTCTKQ